MFMDMRKWAFTQTKSPYPRYSALPHAIIARRYKADRNPYVGKSNELENETGCEACMGGYEKAKAQRYHPLL
jgi:hypothetical protein